MPQNFLPYEPDQLLLLPPSIADWVPEGSQARFVDQLVDELFERGRLEPIYRSYRSDGWGRAAYEPRMMLKVLLYAYCQGVTSSRKIARAVESDVHLRFLSANQQPDFRTISTFRRRHAEFFDELFVEVLGLCREAKLGQLGRVALDGRRVAGNASRGKNRKKESLKREKEELERVVREILEEAERVDREEDELYKDQRGDELPADLRSAKGRAKRLRECLDRLEAKEREEREEYERKVKAREERGKKQKRPGKKPKPPEEKARRSEPVANPTDPESRMMKTQAGSWLQGYNGQAVVDCESQVIVAQGVTNEENDRRQLGPMLEALERQAGGRPKELIADAGYSSEATLGLEDEKTEFFIAVQKDRKYRAEARRESAARGRIPKGATRTERMRRKLLTKRGKKRYAQRCAVEAVFGQMWSRGLSRFWQRGLKRVQSEWSLWCTTHNLLKLYRAGWERAG